jgi:hypothetical protein
MREPLIGFGLAVATCIVLSMLSAELSRDVTAILLTLIASIYIGFSLASNGQLPLIKQIIDCAFFITLALLGMWLSWWFLVAGLGLHGVWDYLHHGKYGQGIIPRWYATFCLVYDWVVALFIAIMYAARS